MSCLSESNLPLLRNKEDQMASSISQGFALCSSRQNYEEPFYVLGWDKKKVQVGKDQEKAQSEKDSHSKNPC